MTRQAAYLLTRVLAPRQPSLRRTRSEVPVHRRRFVLTHAARTWIFTGHPEIRPPCA